MKQKRAKSSNSTGLAIQDVATADMVYRKALEKKIGIKLQQF
ncbi:MAG: hypothetical protein PHU34_11555 [Candidatus Methanoperedens sp.]|nr:hypothetical protein [Candidatus Methanoperedens sp.]